MKLKAIIVIALTILLITATLILLSTSRPSQGKSGYVQVLQSGPTEVNNDITTDTTWTLLGSPYILVKDIKVYKAALLTIEPGVVVKFANGTELYIAGGLRAQGNVTHRITFTSNFTTPTPGIWDSVIFDGIREFLMDYVLVEYAVCGVTLTSVANISSSIVSNCNVGVAENLNYANNITVTDNTGDGLSLSGSLRIENSNVSSNSGHGITITATMNMDNCIVSNNTGNGVVLSNGGDIKNSVIMGNGGNGTCVLGSTTISNTTISGNGGDGIYTGSSISINECDISGNENKGIRGYVIGSMTIQDSNISYNSGDGIWTNSSVEIKGCDVTYNEGSGVIAPGNVNMTVVSSDILNNTLSGLSGHGDVSYSNVSGNEMCGILGNFTIKDYTNITGNLGGGFNGTGTIYWCSIFDNIPYDVVADVWPNNVTATSNWWGTDNGTLIEEHVWHHNDNESLGYVFYDDWLLGPPQPRDNVSPEIFVTSPHPYNGTSPAPYVLWTKFDYYPMVRVNEPVCVSVNITDNESPLPSGVDKVFLSYRVDGGEWWSITMTLAMMYNETSGRWVAIIPGQQTPEKTNSTVEFFIQAYDKAGNMARSPKDGGYHSYQVKWLPIGDITGDGIVDISDVYTAAIHFGET